MLTVSAMGREEKDRICLTDRDRCKIFCNYLAPIPSVCFTLSVGTLGRDLEEAPLVVHRGYTQSPKVASPAPLAAHRGYAQSPKVASPAES